MELIIQKEKSFFNQIGCPEFFGNSIYKGYFFPKALVTNKTYFIFQKNTLVAFRIIAYCIYTKHFGNGAYANYISYYVQFPNEKPFWYDNFLNKGSVIFHNKEEFFKYQIDNKTCVDLNWVTSIEMFPKLKDGNSISLRNNVWYWNDKIGTSNCDLAAYFKHFLVFNNKLYIYTEDNSFFVSKEECIKNQINGMEIIDFDDDTTENYEVVETTYKKVHILRFIEE